MRVFSFLTQPKRNPEWTYTVQGTIWRVMFSESGQLIGECRDQEQKRTSFFCVDELTGKPLWEKLMLDEPWWVGVESIHKSLLLLHKFASPDLPEHKGIFSIDVETGKELWRNEELTFWFVYRDNIYAYKDKFDKRVGHRLSLETGEVLEEHEDNFEDLLALRRITSDETTAEEFQFPEIFDFQSADPPIAAIIRKETKGEQVTGEIEYIQDREYLLLNYHRPTRNSMPEALLLENRFAVIDINRGSEIYADVLATDAKAPAPDSFFIKGSFVYFIKNQNTLTALRLWKS